MIEILLVDGVDLLVLHVLLLEVRVGKVQERTRAQHAAYRTLVQLARLQHTACYVRVRIPLLLFIIKNVRTRCQKGSKIAVFWIRSHLIRILLYDQKFKQIYI